MMSVLASDPHETTLMEAVLVDRARLVVMEVREVEAAEDVGRAEKGGEGWVVHHLQEDCGLASRAHRSWHMVSAQSSRRCRRLRPLVRLAWLLGTNRLTHIRWRLPTWL